MSNCDCSPAHNVCCKLSNTVHTGTCLQSRFISDTLITTSSPSIILVHSVILPKSTSAPFVISQLALIFISNDDASILLIRHIIVLGLPFPAQRDRMKREPPTGRRRGVSVRHEEGMVGSGHSNRSAECSQPSRISLGLEASHNRPWPTLKYHSIFRRRPPRSYGLI